jgi:hypothetical protein
MVLSLFLDLGSHLQGILSVILLPNFAAIPVLVLELTM